MSRGGCGCETVTVPVAAKRLGVGKSTIYRAIAEGRWDMPIRVVRVGNATSLVAADLDRLLGTDEVKGDKQ